MASASVLAGKTENTLIGEHLNCPICLETYRRPKALACLHTFCEECIDSVIVKNAEQWVGKKEIECPVCRKASPSPAPKQEPSEWAKALPLNYAINSLLENLEVGKGGNKVCGPCAEVGEMKDVESFCRDCHEYHCADCARRHTRYSVSRGHRLVKADELEQEGTGSQPLSLGTIEYCDIHTDEYIKYYCEDHTALCCATCAIVGHRPCNKVVEVKEHGRELRQGEAPKQLEKQLKSLQEELGRDTKTLETNVTDLDNQAESIKQKVKKVRAAVIQQMDQMETRVLQDCDQLKKENTMKIQETIFQKKSYFAALDSSSILLRSTLARGSDSQLFITHHKIQQQVRQQELKIREDQGRTFIMQLFLSLDNILETCSQTAASLATVGIKSLPAADRFPLAQCQIQKMPVVDIGKRNQLGHPLYKGLVGLPEGEQVTIDLNNYLFCTIDNAFNVTSAIKLSSQPTDLTVIEHTAEVVLAMPHKKLLTIVDTSTDLPTLTRTISCVRNPRRIVSISSSEFTVAWWLDGLSIIDTSGRENMFLDVDKAGRRIKFDQNDFMAVDVSRSRVFQTCYEEHAVHAFGFTGEPHFAYKNEQLMKPSGIALDRNMSVYICSSGNNTVHQVSPDGVFVRLIDPGMIKPYTVGFDATGKVLFVINLTSHSSKGIRIVFDH